MSLDQKVKTKNQSLYRFFEHLQIEFLVAELRKKIYPSKKDKGYFEKVMSYKKSKIEDIASRNHSLPSIFTNPEIKKAFLDMIINPIGFPDFQYQISDLDQSEMREKDKRYYYSVGSEVRINTDEDILIGEIAKVNFEKDIIFINLKNSTVKEQPFKIDSVTRIL